MYRLSYLREKQLHFEEISSANDITFAAVSVASAANITYIKDSLYSYHVGGAGTITSTKAKTINNVVTAVKSGYAQVQKLPYFEEISGSAARFVAENSIYAFDNYVVDWSTDESKEFYNSIHQLFNEISNEELENGEILTVRNTKVFLMLRDTNYEEFMERSAHRMVVSLTSYPARIDQVHHSVESLLNQTYRADEIILWLSEEEFPEKELPEELLEMERDGNLSIRWCDDLKPHKKYFYALQECSDDIVVTVDDDMYYPLDLLETLRFSYIRFPRAISAGRTRLIAIGSNGDILPYDMWPKETNFLLGKPCMQLLATGCGGVLYPPHCFPEEFFDEALIRELCLRGDDLWLKMMEVHEGLPVVQAMQERRLQYVEGTQETALWTSNMGCNQNDVQMSNIITWYDGKYGAGAFAEKLSAETGNRQTGFEALYQHKLSQEKRNLEVQDTAREFVKRFGSFFTARMDIFLKSANLSEFMLTDVSDSRAKISTPKWAQNGKAGYSIESYQGELELRFRVLKTSEMQINLLGCDVKNPRNKKERLERWMDYTVLAVNSEQILKKITPAWHNKPYVYRFQASEGEEVVIKIEWLPHMS